MNELNKCIRVIFNYNSKKKMIKFFENWTKEFLIYEFFF